MQPELRITKIEKVLGSLSTPEDAKAFFEREMPTFSEALLPFPGAREKLIEVVRSILAQDDGFIPHVAEMYTALMPFPGALEAVRAALKAAMAAEERSKNIV